MTSNLEFNEGQALDKEMEVFWEKGCNAASMREPSDAMQINSIRLNNTIGDKRQL